MTPSHQRGEPRRWTEADAEAQLRSLELFGMRFGLDRMRRMMTALGAPQSRLHAVHVLGTNGKSSTTRMIASILERHGLRTGAYLSPHLVSYRERVLLDGRELSSEEFAHAIATAARAAERVNRTLGENDHVTQFELLTAAALWHMGAQDLDVAVIEAGLGGRYDATSVIDAEVTVLTNVGLEHTRWLGPTVRDIAEEKLAVVRPGGVLALGEGLAPEARAVAERIAGERGARIVSAGHGPRALAHAPGSFQRRNFALAVAGAHAHLQARGIELRERAVAEAAASVDVPGRLQLLSGEPPTVLDGAHNPDAVAALVEALPEVLPPGAPLALVLGVLEDKDATRMLAQLLPLCARAWFTAPPSDRALPPAALESLARQLGYEHSACEPKPARALSAARRWSREHRGSVLATGSVYLVGDLLSRAADGGAVERPNDDARGEGALR